MSDAERAPDFRPLYAQVQDLLIERLASGHWRPGDLLPAEPRLAEEFGVSQGTVRKALDRLADRNVVVRRQGKGTYVTSYTPDRALFHFFQLEGDDGERELPSSRVVSRRCGQAGRMECERLGLAEGAGVVRIVRVRSLRGRAVLAERIAVPRDLFPGLEALPEGNLPNTLYALYETEYGVSVVRADERLKAIAADDEDAALLGVALGTPLLEVNRVALSHDQRPVEWRISRCDTRRHSYVASLD
jgi:GntR family transcriptional regulator